MSETYDNLNKEDYMLTTSDNPFNPYTEFDHWYVWDVSNGYNTCSLLARIQETSDSISDRETRLSYYDAVEKIINLYNVTGNYVKFYKPKDLQIVEYV